MAMKHATKAEVVQVARDLLDPLLDGVHRDVANARAELVAEGKARAAQDEKISTAFGQAQKWIRDLQAQLNGFKQRQSEWRRELDEAKQIRAGMHEALRSIQATQARQQTEIDRIGRQLHAMLKKIAEGAR